MSYKSFAKSREKFWHELVEFAVENLKVDEVNTNMSRCVFKFENRARSNKIEVLNQQEIEST